MSTDVKKQIRGYVSQLEDDQTPIHAAEVLDRLEPVRELPAPSPSKTRPVRRGLWVAVVAAVGALLLIGLLPMLLGGSGEVAPVEPAPAETTQPSPAEDAAELVEAPFVGVETSIGRLVWTEFVGEGAGIPSVQLDIDGYVISGLGDEMLFSEAGTGIGWTTTPSDSGLDDYRVFQSEGEWAVAGQSMWQSSGQPRDLLQSNGRRWIKVDLDAPVNPWPDIPITSGDIVLVRDGRAGFQVSVDGEPFRGVALPWTFPADLVDPHEQTDVRAAPEGGFVAYLWVHDVHPDESTYPDASRDNSSMVFAEVWTSADGVTWTNHGVPAFLSADAINQRIAFTVDETDGLLHAKVRAVDGGALIGEFASTDGLVWQPPSAETIAVNRPTSATYPGVQATNFGYVDSEIDIENREDLAVMRFWISTDGVTWEEVQGVTEPDGMRIGGASVGAVGDILYAGFGGEGEAAIWVGHFER